MTEKEDSYQILLFNYVHYNKEYESGHLNTINNYNRYEAFIHNNDLEVVLNVKNIKSGNYQVTKYFLNRNSGSVYDSWIEIGAPSQIKDEIYEYLKAKEKMFMKIERTQIENDYSINEIINPHGAVFIELKKI